MLRRQAAALLFATALSAAGCSSSAPSKTEETSPVVTTEGAFPERAELLAMIKKRVDEKRATGLVLGVREADGSHTIVAYGNAGPGAKPLSDKSVFEIGSISKVFTGILLADMVAKGEVALEDPVQKHAHPGVTIPQFGDTTIRLVDLSTHMSGLPRLPANLTPADENNPYADYTVAQLHEFLSKHTLSRDVGVKHEYSNLAVGLLGHILAKVAGMSWEELVQERILGPVGMTMSGVTLHQAMKEHLALGHDTQGKVVSNWDLPVFAGAGALRSNAEDMLRFLDANLSADTTPLHKAMQFSHEPREAADGNMKIGLGWLTSTNKGGLQGIWHGGGTGGYRTIIAMDAKRGIGVVVLENSTHGSDDLAIHLLDPSVPLSKAPSVRTEIAVPKAILATYEGVYKLGPNFHLHVSVVGDALYTQATGQPKLQVFAEKETEFFLKEVDAQLSFESDEEGKITRVVLHQGGADMPAPRLEGEAATKAIEAIAGKQRSAIELPEKILKNYVGVYQLTPTFKLQITLEDKLLHLQATGQDKTPIFAEAKGEFFSKVVDAQITFVSEKGKVTSLVLHQGGMDQKAPRVD